MNAVLHPLRTTVDFCTYDLHHAAATLPLLLLVRVYKHDRQYDEQHDANQPADAAVHQSIVGCCAASVASVHAGFFLYKC